MNISTYLSRLPKSTREELLKQPHCCLALFKNLSEQDRLLVLHLMVSPLPYSTLCSSPDKLSPNLYLPPTKEKADIAFPAISISNTEKDFCSMKEKNEFKVAQDNFVLVELQIITPLSNNNLLVIENGYVSLEEIFRVTLYRAFQTVPIKPVVLDSKIQKSYVDSPTLLEYCKSKWEYIIMPLVELALPDNKFFQIFGKANRSTKLDKKLYQLYRDSKLIDDSGTSQLSLVTSGYKFLLSDISSQLWLLLSNWISNHIDVSIQAKIVDFLIYLSTVLSQSVVYSVNQFSTQQQQFLQDLEFFGFVYFLKTDDQLTHFCTTPLCTQIFEESSKQDRNVSDFGNWLGGILVESNFYLYAYTDSLAVIASIALFAEILHRLPNLCTAKITRKSVNSAFKLGIHAKHIIDYLYMNRRTVSSDQLVGLQATENELSLTFPGSGTSLHEDEELKQMFLGSDRSSRVTQQVEEQLLFWEEERFRFEWHYAIWWEFEPSDHPELYQSIKEHAEMLGYLLWNGDDKQKVLCIKKIGHNSLVEFYYKLKSRLE